ncbi:MAG: hypothetical protein ACOCZ5_02925, partial [bacterium]
MKKVNKNYINTEFNFKTLREVKDLTLEGNNYLSLGKDFSVFQSSTIGNNSTEYIKGIDIYVLHDTETPEYNLLVFSPGRCRITKLDTMETKLHYNHLQQIVKYEASNLLSDGSTINDTYGFIYIYSEFNETNSELNIKFSSIAPTRDKYGNTIKSLGERKTLYHPALNARCIGTLTIGEYFTQEEYGDGKMNTQLIRDNILNFSAHNLYNLPGGSSNSGTWYLTDFVKGGFPVTVYGVNVTVAGGNVEISQTDLETDGVED